MSSSAENNGNVLKKVIFHGHALTLFDKLDQITAIERREKIIDHIRQFLDQYARSPSFASVFDQEMFDLQTIGNSKDLFNEINYVRSCRKRRSYQIIIASVVLLDTIFIHFTNESSQSKRVYAKLVFASWKKCLSDSVKRILSKSVKVHEILFPKAV